MKTTRIINGSEIKGTLSLLNVITFTIACTIGAGIFLKSQNNVNYA
ncbi:hypothetical protein FACS189459_0780 [Bacilli bacterium]|nr:hypothetical protein FACS189459_0780 [Bacilli bacterium]